MKHYTILICLLFAIVVNMSTTAKARTIDVNDSLALVSLFDSTNRSG